MKVDLKSDSNRHILSQESASVIEEDMLPHILQMPNKDENEVAEQEKQLHQKQQTPMKVSSQAPIIAKQPVRIVPAKRVEHIGSTIPAVRQINATKTIKITPNKPPSQDSKPAASSSSVIPLLTAPEICRQLLELRKQNEELRRKFDLAQKEKEEMRQRIERLEELLLVERTDEVFTNS